MNIEPKNQYAKIVTVSFLENLDDGYGAAHFTVLVNSLYAWTSCSKNFK